MAKTFQQRKAELVEACTLLRPFTLGKPGCTLRQGHAVMDLITKACLRLDKAFGSGSQALLVKSALAAARGCMEAAKARMEILKSKR